VPGLLKAADVLVLPSLWAGMPNIVLEAMAARRGGRDGRRGTEDLVVPDQTGWLVPPANATALADRPAGRRGRPGTAPTIRRGGPGPGRGGVLSRAVVAAYDRLWSGLLGYEMEEMTTDDLKPGLAN